MKSIHPRRQTNQEVRVGKSSKTFLAGQMPFNMNVLDGFPYKILLVCLALSIIGKNLSNGSEDSVIDFWVPNIALLGGHKVRADWIFIALKCLKKSGAVLLIIQDLHFHTHRY
jgi:hypothetical protein